MPVDLGAIDGKPWGSLAAVAGKVGQPTTQWSEHLRIFRQALSTALVNHGKNERPFADGPEVKAVTEAQVREEFNRIAMSIAHRKSVRTRYANNSRAS